MKVLFIFSFLFLSLFCFAERNEMNQTDIIVAIWRSGKLCSPSDGSLQLPLKV